MAEIDNTRVTTEQERRTPLRRPFGSFPITVTGTTPGTGTTIGTAPDGAQVQIVALIATNNANTNNETLTIHMVPDGDVADDSNIILNALSVASETTVKVIELDGWGIGIIMPPISTLLAYGSNAGDFTVQLSVTEIR